MGENIKRTDEGLVSVLMAVYNGAKYLSAAISSILSQEYPLFELLIINDGSTDQSAEIIQNFKDKRIRYIENPKNMGLHYTRNLGVQLAKGEYIAIQDCDDISFSNRLKEQIHFLQSTNGLAACGCSADLINEDGLTTGQVNVLRYKYSYIPSFLVFSNLFINSSMIFKAEIIKKFNYNEGYVPAEDYDLVERIINSGYHVQNINKKLIQYRLHNSNISSVKRDERISGEKKILIRQLEQLGIFPSKTELQLHHDFLSGIFSQDFDVYQKWLLKLKAHNKLHKQYNFKEFELVLFMQLYKIYLNKGRRPGVIFKVVFSALFPLRYIFELLRIFAGIK